MFEGAYWLYGLDVKEECRRRGYARAIVQKAISYAEQSGNPVIYLTPAPFKNSPMNSNQLTVFYESLGFESVELEGYENVHLMRFSNEASVDQTD